MTIADLANGAFELGGGFMLIRNCFALYRDKIIKGVSIPTTMFFMAWGWWNALWYYPSLDQWASFSGGLVIVAANTVWVAMAIYYSKTKKRIESAAYTIRPTDSEDHQATGLPN